MADLRTLSAVIKLSCNLRAQTEVQPGEQRELPVPRPSCQYCFAMASILAVLVAPPALGDRWPQPTETLTSSQSGEYCLHVSPSPSVPESFGNCAAELYKMGQSGPTLIWERQLINNVMPVRTFVTNSGKYVVTMDEWADLRQFPVVIYGDRGRLIKVHDETTLNLAPDTFRMAPDLSARLEISLEKNWSQYAVVFFGPDEETVFIRLCWGRIIMLRLADGQLLEKDSTRPLGPHPILRTLHQFATQRVQEIAMELLQSPHADDRLTGTLVARDYRLLRARPRLQALLSDPSTLMQGPGSLDDPSATRVVFYIREAAQTALDAIAAAPSTQPASGNDSEAPFVTEDPPLRSYYEAIPPWERPGRALLDRPPWTPFVDQSRSQEMAIQRLFGVVLEGCRVAGGKPHAVGIQAGLRANDKILAINGRPVTDRTLWPVLTGTPLDEIRLLVQREEGAAEIVVRPIEPPRDIFKPLECLGKRVTELSDDPEANERRSRWLTDLGSERKVIILSCWGNEPGSWMTSLNLLVSRFQDRGLRWLTVGCPTEEDEEKWKAAIAEYPVRAKHVRDLHFYSDLKIRYLSWPTHFILDADGTVLYCQLDEAEVIAAVKGLMGVK